jgi:hypothetical protein
VVPEILSVMVVAVVEQDQLEQTQLAAILPQEDQDLHQV